MKALGMTTILTTTGISLFTNTGRKLDTQEPTDDQMRQYLRMEPERASAEANSLLQIAQFNDQIVLLHTDTVEARKCAELLQEFFGNRGFKHIRLIALQFQEDEQHIETLGIRNLVNTLIDEVEKARKINEEVVINATAGFKAQIVYSTMIGMLYQVPVKYIYEQFHRIVTFNPIPLDWDTSLFLTYNWFFRWVDDEFRFYSEVELKLKDLPDGERIRTLLTLPDKDGYVFLSPMGDALRRRFEREAEDAAQVPYPPQVNIVNIDDKIASSLLETKHHYPKNTVDACRKIAQLPYVELITGGFFEPTLLSGVRKVSEDGTIILLWADNEKAARLIVHTTAIGGPQTLKVAATLKEILGIN
jgi:putative CRISPR-associated protein (TIGR02619 family)